MARLLTKDFDHLHRAIQDLYGHRELDTFPEAVLSAIGGLIPHDHLTYNEVDFDANQIIAVSKPNIEIIPKLAPVLAAYQHQHPTLSSHRRTGKQAPARITDSMTQREFERLEMYNEFYRHVNVRYQLSCSLPDLNGQNIILAVNRSRRDFSARDRTVLEHLYTHVSRAYLNAQAFSEVRGKFRLLQTACEKSDVALIALTGRDRIDWMTPPAERLLAKYFPSHPKGSPSLPDAVRRWLNGRRSDGAGVRSNGRPTNRFATSKKKDQLSMTLGSDSDENGILLLREVKTRTPAESICLADLTPREQEVLYWIAEGKNNPEIAIILNTAVRTIHKHVERIFAKLGVENRAAAIVRAMKTE